MGFRKSNSRSKRHSTRITRITRIKAKAVFSKGKSEKQRLWIPARNFLCGMTIFLVREVKRFAYLLEMVLIRKNAGLWALDSGCGFAGHRSSMKLAPAAAGRFRRFCEVSGFRRGEMNLDTLAF